ncbi:T9SS type A sorting domain-containing protein [Fibrella sp. HMF5335]|uniref:T9SS type A sorting domain-containing protein n=1 Tax=Fibrella rubiginis TaxID=2817060 RepID=A0A939GDJ7_9BACT|nr:T9SS type A sorting domain-containing protein [Fibrella rubiginis]MBO0935264.1 T9SS type A sorting domain-containing protein [Fibrella rubiginis]
MKNAYSSLLCLFCLLLSVAGWAQSISLTNAPSGAYCGGAAVSISFTTTGTFGPGNVFKVQLSADKGANYIDLPESSASSPVLVTLPAAVTGAGGYVYRVVASQPQVVSNPSDVFKLVSLPSAQLTGSSLTGPINPYSAINLQMTLTGGGPYTVTLQDSTQFIKPEDDVSVTLPVRPAQSTTYRLASVRNACGTGPVSGSVAVAVNTVGFNLQVRPSEMFCLGSTVPIYFTTSGPLPANTVFEAELINERDNNSITKLPVTGSSSPLQITLPAESPGPLPYGYQLRIFSRTAGVSGYYNPALGVYLTYPARIAMPQSVSFAPGVTSVAAPISYTGLEGGSALLSNGETVWLSNTYPSFRVDANSPITSYSLVSYTGACSQSARFINRVTRVIKPSMLADSLSTKMVCAGQPVTLYYSTKPGYRVPDQLSVRLKSWYESDPGVVAEVTATKAGQVTFVPPPTMVARSGIVIELRDAAVDTLLMMFRSNLVINTVPQLMFSKPLQTASAPGDQFLEIQAFGGGTMTIALSDGTKSIIQGGYFNNAGNFLRVYTASTTSYSTVSVSNACGTMPLSASTTVAFRNATTTSPALYISPNNRGQSYFCPGAQEWLNITSSGTFADDNQFQIELGDQTIGSSWTVIQSFSKAESRLFTLPSTPGKYLVRVSSTNPVIRSAQGYYSISTPSPLVAASVQSASGILKSVNSQPISITLGPDEYLSAVYSIEGRAPARFDFSDGVSVDPSEATSIYARADRYFQPKTTNTYAVKQVTDLCGVSTTAVGGQVNLTVRPLRLLTYRAGDACVGSPVRVEFVASGYQPASVSYVVQATVNGQSNWQTLPTSGTASPLTTYFPASMAGKQVNCRVAYLLDGEWIPATYTTQLKVSALPSVTLTGPNNTTVVELDRSSAARAELKLSDALTTGTTILVYGSTSQIINTSTTSQSLFVSQPGTYSLAGTYNECGYGTVQGVVRVIEKPYLAASTLSKTSGCTGESTSLSYALGGAYDPDNIVSIYLVNTDNPTDRTLLTETTTLNGGYSLTLNPALRAGNYTVQYVTSAPARTFVGSVLTVRTPVSVSLMSGTKAVYATDSPSLAITTSGNTGPYTLTLATPTNQVVLTGEFTNAVPLATWQPGSYSVVGVSSQCGVGKATGTVSLVAIPVGDVTIRPVASSRFYCYDKQYVINLNTTGAFNPSNVFTAYLADSTGGNQVALPTVYGPNQLTVTVPASLRTGDRYTLRVGSSSPEHLGASLMQNLSVQPSPTALITGATSVYKGDSARVSIALTGTAPWQLTIADKAGPRSYTAATSPYVLTVRPDTTTSYRLTEVRNAQCGVGTATGTAQISVSPLLATEPVLSLTVRVWPNPTAGVLQLEGQMPGRGEVAVGLHTVTGSLVHQSVGEVRQGLLQHRIDLSGLPTGLYILTTEQEGRRSQFKVLKQ